MNKRFFVLVYLIVLVISCDKKDETSVKRISKPILVSANLDIYKDFSPDSIIKPFEKCTKVGNQTACGMINGKLDFDLNNDKRFDIRFEASIGSMASNMGVKSSLVSVLDTAFQILLTPRIANDEISNTLTWTKAKLIYLAKSPGGYGYQEDYNLFSDSKFLAFRHITTNDTLFGWIKLSIQDYNNMTIDSYSMQK